jgi:hypothetical protein
MAVKMATKRNLWDTGLWVYRFIGVSDIAAVRFSLPAQLLEPTPNLGTQPLEMYIRTIKLRVIRILELPG